MASLLKILAVSVGSGIVLGAGIRLGEAMAAQLPAPGSDAANKLAERLDDLENRLSAITPASQAQEELRGWIEETVAQRMADLEIGLKAESLQGQKEILDAFASGVETRMIQRISRLEEEVGSHSASMHELRECSLRTETSVQKLLGGLDKLIVKNAPAAAEEVQPAAAGAASSYAPLPPLTPFDLSEKPRRWKLFG